MLGFDYKAATVIALVLGGADAVLAVATNWTTGIVKIIPPLLYGYVDVIATVALIIPPFRVGSSYRTNALLFYVIVGAAGLVATLATRSSRPRRMPADSTVMVHEAAWPPRPSRHTAWQWRDGPISRPLVGHFQSNAGRAEPAASLRRRLAPLRARWRGSRVARAVGPGLAA